MQSPRLFQKKFHAFSRKPPCFREEPPCFSRRAEGAIARRE